jgi:tryptophan synthase beta subunit
VSKKDKTLIQQFIRAATAKGRFGPFGGMYVPELLVQPLKELEIAFKTIAKSRSFQEKLTDILRSYAGRPTALSEVKRFAAAIGKARIFLKREDLLHTGAHKLNNALGQCLLAQKMGKTRIIAETGAGQHGVAVATACALLGLQCAVFMGAVDIERQAPNVAKMRLLGAEVISVKNGSATLKDAINEALRDWAHNYDTTHYCIGSALGPHPFPIMVAAFQQVIGEEAKEQFYHQVGRHPDLAIACVGGGSNAIGLFSAYLDDLYVDLIGVEAGGNGSALGHHAARFQGGLPGVLHGSYTYLLQTPDRQVASTHSISAGLDYPAVGPQHAQLFLSGRARYETASDDQALAAFQLLARTEGIIPALESSHALGYVMQIAPELEPDTLVLVNLSGRGDKDLPKLLEKELSHVAHR